MEKKCIKQVIVVEGHHDSAHLKRFYDCLTIETSGTGLRKEVIEAIRQANQTRGVIIFTDPDSAGTRIRNKINKEVPGCMNAYLLKQDARTKHKVGVEHASFKALDEALCRLIVCTPPTTMTITTQAMLNLGLLGSEDAGMKREKVCNALHIECTTGKAFQKRMNEMGITEEKLREILNG